jgi:hypothetical protein
LAEAQKRLESIVHRENTQLIQAPGQTEEDVTPGSLGHDWKPKSSV